MKGLRRLLLVAAATAGLALSLTGCSKTVDFLQYADVTFDGLNGQATATVNVDYQTKAGKAHDFNRGMKGRTLELLWEKFQNNSFLYIFMCL